MLLDVSLVMRDKRVSKKYLDNTIHFLFCGICYLEYSDRNQVTVECKHIHY